MHRPRVYLSASVVRIELLSLLDCPLGQLVRSQSALANERSCWLVVHACQRRYLADQLLENSRSDRRLRQADGWSNRQDNRLICQPKQQQVISLSSPWQLLGRTRGDASKCTPYHEHRDYHSPLSLPARPAERPLAIRLAF
jgi:hypothetical protein